MSVSAVKALCLVLPLVSGLSVPLPAPTLGYVDSSNPPTPAPQTTPPPRLESRQDYLTVVTWKVTGEPSMCGFEDGNIDNYVTCDDAMTCAYQRPNEKYVGMLGCCEEGLKDCIFFSTCINLSQVSATPSLSETPQPLAWYCTDPASPACYTWLYSDMSVTDFGCSTEPGVIEMYTTAKNATTTSDKLLLYDLYLTQVGSEAVDSYLATFSSEHGLNTATNTPTGTNSPSSGESKKKGAIAGGVVGGVAGLALIGAAGFFVRRKMNSKKTQGAEGVEANDDKGPYSSVPELHSPYLANKPQFVSEMGTNETKQQLSEVDGSTPANRVYEMQETTVKGTEGKNFAAELPADSEFPATR